VQRLWLRISRTGLQRHLTHLEAMNGWLRALRRAKVPLAYSQGFHPHPKFAFSSAMPHGEQSWGEYLDLVLVERVVPEELLARLQAKLPDGFGAHAVAEVPLNAPSLMSVNHGHDYRVLLPHLDGDAVRQRVSELASAAEIRIERPARPGKDRGPQRLDLRASILSITMVDGAAVPTVEVRVVVTEHGTAKSRDLVRLFTTEPEKVVVMRLDTLTAKDGGYRSLSEGFRAAPSGGGFPIEAAAR
jgi:radical SAM-linked protein